MKKVDQRRVYRLNETEVGSGPIVYWMSREQRVDDNWGLLFAEELAVENKRELVVAFFLSPAFLNATIRQYDFMIKGLREVEEKLSEHNIRFLLFLGNPEVELENFSKDISPGAVVLDFDPLKIKKRWKKKIIKKIDAALFEVDGHNIVPCREASSKQEYAAYTIRPKIKNKLNDFLVEFPKLKKREGLFKRNKINWGLVYNSLKVDFSVEPVDWIFPGEKEAKNVLKEFIDEKLDDYDEKRNDPNSDAQSNLSPYLHFGQISSQRVVLEINKSKKKGESKEAFLEELIIRKELADNYCYYNESYDSFDGFPDWAKKSLNSKRINKRDYNYSKKEFEEAKTHDDLWNAAQQQMVKTGKMHGYVRMYWAKKILEWSRAPETAQRIAIYLNDKYELDGRDPNGYAGIAWSIGGVHDRAWFERPIFGKVRYMSYNGSKGKFNVQKYINKFL